MMIPTRYNDKNPMIIKCPNLPGSCGILCLQGPEIFRKNQCYKASTFNLAISKKRDSKEDSLCSKTSTGRGLIRQENSQ